MQLRNARPQRGLTRRDYTKLYTRMRDHKLRARRASKCNCMPMTFHWPIKFENWKVGQEFKKIGARFDFRLRAPLMYNE